MEFIQDYATLLPRLLPASIASPLLTLLTTALGITRTLQTHLTPFLTRLVTQPDVASIMLVIVIFFVSMKILDMMYRAVIFWINLVFQLVLWGGMAVLGVWIYTRGVDGFVQDVTDLGHRWVGEYEKYSEEVKMFKLQQEQQVRMKAGQKQRRGWR
ncbi:hypothetical protein ACN47E_005412 [Coniothyrium glycines]